MSVDDERTSKYRNDPRSTDELLGLALTKDADRDNDGYWHPIAALQHRLPQIIERIEALGNSGDEKSRDTAATILGQNLVEAKLASNHCAAILLQMLAKEKSTHVLPAIIFALGHLHDPRAVEPLVGFSRHSDPRVRYATVSSLCGHDDNRSIEAMIACSSDHDSDVRNWATFGLGSQIDTDTPAIRDALFARLEEKDDEIRGEALVGLACRGDIRVVAPLLKELDTLETEILRDWSLIVDAAKAVVTHASASGSKEWQPVLVRLAELGIGKREELQSAMNRCALKQQ